jgi:hypothetical protein
MPLNSILESTSYSTLDNADMGAVDNLFTHYQSDEPLLALDTPTLFCKRKSLTVSLDYYGSRLKQINPASFIYLTPEQKEAQRQEILFAFYIFSAQYQLDKVEQRRQQLKDRSRQIWLCASLIEKLNSVEENTPEEVLNRLVANAGKHGKYLGLTIVAPFIAEKMMELISNETTKELKGAGKTEVLRNWMNDINGLRLYWVWGGGLLNTVLSMLPDDFANTPQAQQGIAAPAPITGYMSWILYYARFGINLSLLLKHTIAGPWMSQEERNIPAWDRFKTQWDQRKFALLNDSIWGAANMVCFFWLTGGGMLGYYGNVATALLLLMDVSLTVWKFHEESTQHKVNLVGYERDITSLAAKIDEETDPGNQTILQLQLKELKKAQKQCKFDWRHKEYALRNDLVYAVALLAAFCIMCCFLFPPAAMAPAVAVIIGVVGAALCFVCTAAYSAVKGGLEIEKVKQTRQMVKNECAEILERFKASDNESEKKHLYLEMKQLFAQTEYQHRLINFQKMKLVRSILIDVLVPPLVFISLVFMPMGIGIAVMAAGLALALITNLILKRFEPKAPILPNMNEDEYKAFALNPSVDALDVNHRTLPAPKRPMFWGTCTNTITNYARIPTSDDGSSTDDSGLELTNVSPAGVPALT